MVVNHIIKSGFHNIPQLKIKEWGDWLGVDRKLYGQIIAFCIKYITPSIIPTNIITYAIKEHK